MSGVGRVGQALQDSLGNSERLYNWALRDRSLWDGHLRESLGLGHSRETLANVNSGSLGLHGVSGVGHSREPLGVDRARRRVPGEGKS